MWGSCDRDEILTDFFRTRPGGNSKAEPSTRGLAVEDEYHEDDDDDDDDDDDAGLGLLTQAFARPLANPHSAFRNVIRTQNPLLNDRTNETKKKRWNNEKRCCQIKEPASAPLPPPSRTLQTSIIDYGQTIKMRFK